jgi:hypothetical protein
VPPRAPPPAPEIRCPLTGCVIAAERCIEWQFERGCGCSLAADFDDVLAQRDLANKPGPAPSPEVRQAVHRHILGLLDRGLRQHEVAAELGVSTRTVSRVHVRAHGRPVEPRLDELPVCVKCGERRVRVEGKSTCSRCAA